MGQEKQSCGFSARETAQCLRTTLSFVYCELWAGRFPGAEKIGRRWLIPRSALLDRLKTKRARKNHPRSMPGWQRDLSVDGPSPSGNRQEARSGGPHG